MKPLTRSAQRFLADFGDDFGSYQLAERLYEIEIEARVFEAIQRYPIARHLLQEADQTIAGLRAELDKAGR